MSGAPVSVRCWTWTEVSTHATRTLPSPDPRGDMGTTATPGVGNRVKSSRQNSRMSTIGFGAWWYPGSDLGGIPVCIDCGSGTEAFQKLSVQVATPAASVMGVSRIARSAAVMPRPPAYQVRVPVNAQISARAACRSGSTLAGSAANCADHSIPAGSRYMSGTGLTTDGSTQHEPP